MADAGIPEVVVAAWDRASAAWDDPKRHETVLALVTQYSCFAWAAGRYRERAGDPVADAQLERLRKAATATMFATATTRPDQPRRNTMLIVVMLLLMVVMILIGLGVMRMMAHGHHEDDTTDVQH